MFPEPILERRIAVGRSALQAKKTPGDAPPAWPSIRFRIALSPHDNDLTAHGLLNRDADALIVEFEFPKKKVKKVLKEFKHFFPEPGRPQEVRIPLDQIASLTYGWGWGRPPRSLIVKVNRLSALAGIPAVLTCTSPRHIRVDAR